MDSEESRKKGNEKFMSGSFIEAITFYDRAIELNPECHLSLSNRSLTYCRLQKYDQALLDAEECIRINPEWAKGYLRKAISLNLLKRHEDAKSSAVIGFNLTPDAVNTVSTDLVKEWLIAGKALMVAKHAPLMKKLAEVIPDYAEMFCDSYCSAMFSVVLHRLSDADSLSHDQMIIDIGEAVDTAKEVMETFKQPPPISLEEFSKAASMQIDLYPLSDHVQLKQTLEDKAAQLVKWLDESAHPSLLQVLKPIVLLVHSAILVRCNSLCQMYTSHNSANYLGTGCIALFSGKAFSDPIYSALNLASLNILLTVYRTKGETPSSEDIEQIRITCHKMDAALQKLPQSYPNYDLIKSHYEQSVKVAREICAKVLSGFSMSHDPLSALSELELAFLAANSDPDKAIDVALKYLQDIAQKVSLSESGAISHVNFIDAENMLYLTGIFMRIQNQEMAQNVFSNGENMLLSLIATVLVKNKVSLDELPATVTNGRQFALSAALALRNVSTTITADAIIRWKSFFTELRAVLIQLGLRNGYKQAFESLENCIKPQESYSKVKVLTEFKQIESKLLESAILPVINALYLQKASLISDVLEENDVVLDYSFFIYNPEYRNPPKSQACGLAILPSGDEPILFMLDNDRVKELVIQLPKAIYSLWHDYNLQTPVLSELSELLFPPVIREVLLRPGVKRLFISPDVDLLCFPIDQLPFTDDSGITKPLFEYFSISLLSSPRELLRDKTIHSLKDQLHASTSDENILKQLESISVQEENLNCFIVANPDFEHKLVQKLEPSIASKIQAFLTTFSNFFFEENFTKDPIPPLPKSENEANNVYTLLSMSERLQVHLPITGSEATIHKLMNMQSPHVLHLATHGYSEKQMNKAYRGNFWVDTASGILLAGAKTFQQNKIDEMDPRTGTGYMSSVAGCGMDLTNTRLVFISACNSSVGSRPTQEMPSSFTQAIRSAGSDTVVSTLWTVVDDEAVEFVSYFYDHLMSKSSCKPSEALSYAKLMMKQTGKSMFHWGAYMCHGLDKPLF
jgi:tetratricopeptide (TPR) repeat protein